MEVYHKKSRTRSTTWVPRRVYYVLRHLQRTLTPGTAQAISNKQIQTAIHFGSEGEVSQIMRWLSGEQPTMGRWAYGALNTNAQTYRFITRERLPHGGYSVTLLATPERIDAPVLHLPQVVQLSFFDTKNDPSMIPHAGHSDAAQGGSFFHDPFDDGDRAQPKAAQARSQGDQHEETPKIQSQEEESARSPLFARLLAQPGMSRRLAQQIADRPLGTIAEFEHDLQIATTFAKSPFFFTVAKWRDQERVAAPEESTSEHPARSAAPSGARRRSRTNRPDQAAHPTPAPDYAALIAEWERTEPLGPITVCVPGQRRAAHGDG